MTFLSGIILIASCSADNPGDNNPPEVIPQAEIIVIFSINDPHGKIHNFDRINHRQGKRGGDAGFFRLGRRYFSGYPIVDYHPQKVSPPEASEFSPR